MNLTDLLTRAEEIVGKATPAPWRYGEVHNGCSFIGTACDRPLPLIGYNFAVRQQAPNEDAAAIVAMRGLIAPLLDVAMAAGALEQDPHYLTTSHTALKEALARLAVALP